MRIATLALVLALGLATASAQPVVDGDLTDDAYLLLDDNAGGPASSFGTTDQLNAIVAHVDVPSSALYLGLAGSLQFNRALVFLDTRDGGYADANYGTVVGGGGGGTDAFNALNPDTAWDPGFLADFAVEINVFEGTTFVTLIELVGDRVSGEASVSTFVGSSNDPVVGTAYTTDAAVTTSGVEIAIPFSADGSLPLQITAPAFSAFPMVISNTGFISNQLLSPADAGQGNYGFDGPDFGAAAPAGAPGPVAYAWQRIAAEGWRQYEWPFETGTVADLFAQNHVQGVPGTVPNGGDNLYQYGGTGGPGYTEFASSTSLLDLTRGFFWYHYTSAPSPAFTPLPFTYQAGGVEFAGLATRNEYAPTDATGATASSYLLGNPYAAGFDTAFLTELTGYTLSNSVFVWNPELGPMGDYVEYDRAAPDAFSRTVPPTAGFWAELTDPSGGTLGAADFRWDPAGRVRAPAPPPPSARRGIAFELDLLDGDTAVRADHATRLVFAEGAGAGVDAFDAGEPPAISAQGARLALVAGEAYRAVEGRELDPEAPVSLRLALRADAMGAQTYRLGWDASSLPDGWRAELRDLATGATTDLRVASELVFPASDMEWEDLYELVVTPAGVVSAADAPAGAEVTAPRPNPSAGAATMRVQVDRSQAVTVEAYDLLGRRVAVLFDGVVETATAVPVGSDALAPGVYLVRVTGETFAATHRFTIAR